MSGYCRLWLRRGVLFLKVLNRSRDPMQVSKLITAMAVSIYVRCGICMIGMCVTARLGGVASKWSPKVGVSDNLLPEMDMFQIS